MSRWIPKKRFSPVFFWNTKAFSPILHVFFLDYCTSTNYMSSDLKPWLFVEKRNQQELPIIYI